MKKILSLLFLSLSFLLVPYISTAETVWIDVRTVNEYSDDHIDGDANIPLAEIKTGSLAALYNKGDEIKLYCRSGNRSGQAKTILNAAGFTNVTNAGSIAEVRILRKIADQNSSQ